MTKEEIYPEVLAYFNGDTLAANVCIDKYLMKTQEGVILEKSPDDLHRRMAKEFARIENNYPNPVSEEEIYQLFKGFKYIVPQGSPMVGIGNNNLMTSLSNCFVIGDNNGSDSYGGIMRSDEEQIQLMKRRGGVGHDLSHLRPAGAMANNSALNDMAGSVLYAQRFSNSTKEVRQGDRRGALMLSMSINHPDAEKFIDSKMVSGQITDANISLRITDKFMEAVENDTDFIQYFPIDMNFFDLGSEFPCDYSELEYDKLIKGISGKTYLRKIKAKRLWDKLIFNAWKSAEPGILFWDNIIRESPADCYENFQTVGVNPCAELTLSSYDACRLLLLNIFSYVENQFQNDSYFNFDKFKEDVIIAQRLMDDLVDLELEKIDLILKKIDSDKESDEIKSVEKNLWLKVREKTQEGRRTGLGVTGEGDMLAALGLTYGSKEGTELAVKVHKTLATYSYISSIQMAETRGCFKSWSHEKEVHNPFIHRVMESVFNEVPSYLSKYVQSGRRNISNLTISPAGSVSICTQTTSGIEPVFLVAYKRRRRTIDKLKATFIDPHGEMFEEYFVFHSKFEEWYDKNWFKTDPHLFDIDYKKPLEMYNQEELAVLISKSPYHNSTSADVDWEAKVSMQGQIQKWVDHSISATTNIPENTPVEMVDKVYRTAHKSGCKGMTIYREGSRSGILVSNNEIKDELLYIDAVKRPKELPVDIYHKTALKENWIIIVGKLGDKPYEIWAFPEVENHLFPTKITKGKLIKTKSRHYRLVGEDLGKTYEIENIVALVGDLGQSSTRKFSMMLRHHIDPKWIIQDISEYQLVNSFEKVIQRVLKNYVIDDGEKCSECGGELIHKDGCVICKECGWSKCG